MSEKMWRFLLHRNQKKSEAENHQIFYTRHYWLASPETAKFLINEELIKIRCFQHRKMVNFISKRNSHIESDVSFFIMKWFLRYTWSLSNNVKIVTCRSDNKMLETLKSNFTTLLLNYRLYSAPFIQRFTAAISNTKSYSWCSCQEWEFARFSLKLQSVKCSFLRTACGRRL